MLYNTAILNQVIETAKAKCANDAYLLRAIDRAAKELSRAYWNWNPTDRVLTIKSTTSSKLYKVDAQHSCEATQNGKVCKHKIQQRLMLRYHEALEGN